MIKSTILPSVKVGAGVAEKSVFRKPFPKSLPVTTIMKLGKAISTKTTPPISIEVSKFDIDSLQWSCFQSVEFAVEESEFARGGFRAALKATSVSSMFLGKQLVIKHYLPETLKVIQSVNETTEIHARKSVQMIALAGNLASQLNKINLGKLLGM